jgi:hypothetical protein
LSMSLDTAALVLYTALKAEHNHLTAWSARNLMEIDIWTAYCVASEANARRFYDDAMRDANDLMKALKGFMDMAVLLGEFKNAQEQWSFSYNQALLEIERSADERGIADFQSKNTFIKEAADAVGFTHFSFMNKLMSKFVHQTAMSVMLTSPFDEQRLDLRQIFGTAGTVEALNALAGIESFAGSLE